MPYRISIIVEFKVTTQQQADSAIEALGAAIMGLPSYSEAYSGSRWWCDDAGKIISAEEEEEED